MKKIQTSILVLLLLVAVSCKKTDNSAATVVVSTDQIADIASSSLSSSSVGLSTNFDDMASNAQSLSSVEGPGKAINAISTNNPGSQECGTTVTDSTTKSNTAGAITYGYFLKYTHTLNCNTSNQHDDIVYDLAFHGYYNGPNITSRDTGTSSFTIAGFTAGATNFSVNGHYNRHGAFTSKIGDKVSGTSDVSIVITSLTISKSTRVITGGSATITITITVPKGTKTFTGALTFNGDGTANFTIDGSVYVINLLTGVRIKH